MIRVNMPVRRQFEGFMLSDKRWAVVVAHRRCGKTVACIQRLVKEALQSKRSRPRYAYFAPLLKQAKTVAWDYLKTAARAIAGTTAHETELRVDFPNGAQIRLYGADNPDAVRGIYLDGVVLDEAADMSPRIFPEILRPALSDRKGWCVWIGTPKGRNEFYHLWQMAQAEDDWFTLMLKASDTGLIDADELADARKMMSSDEYDQEYLCSFDAAIKGAIYGDELRRMREDKRITRIPIDRGLRVWTAWDLGVSDSTAIWFGQTVGREEHLIDYYEGSGVGLDHYAAILRDKGYVYSDHYFPHDVAHRELSTGTSRVETLNALGINPVIVPVHAVMDGVNATRRYMDRLWIDEHRCKRGLEALTQYRREYDEKLKVFKNNPLHDWCSHAADALRMRAASAPYTDMKQRYGRRDRNSGSSSSSWLVA